MQTVISGICVGFRIIKGTGKEATDYGKFHVLQVGTKTLDADLIPVFIFDLNNLQFFLTNYSNGALRWINAITHQEMDGREKVWVVDQVLDLQNQPIPIQGVLT